jgi:hypothetical protein
VLHGRDWARFFTSVKYSGGKWMRRWLVRCQTIIAEVGIRHISLSSYLS